MSILIHNVSKFYGQHCVLDSISLTIELGQCFWLVGRNGAGKSTMINILADLIAPTNGEVSIGGKYYENPNEEVAIKRHLGVLPDKNPAVPQLSGWEYLQFVGLLHDLATADIKERSESLLSYFFDDPDEPYSRISGYSVGMLKKIGLCAALLHRPTYLLLDEPFSGLDPVMNTKVVQLLQSYLTPERAILLSSHDLGYTKKVITHIGILDGARLHFAGTIEAFQATSASMEESVLSVLLPAATASNDIGNLDWLL
jgi:ABC-2 type transport system ATP-binding protein